MKGSLYRSEFVEAPLKGPFSAASTVVERSADRRLRRVELYVVHLAAEVEMVLWMRANDAKAPPDTLLSAFLQYFSRNVYFLKLLVYYSMF